MGDGSSVSFQPSCPIPRISVGVVLEQVAAVPLRRI